jgi:GNAT superfamily N-acetyltransferase
MQQDRYVIRSMTRPEFDLALDWAAAEGWNPGLHDAAAFHAADPEGFLIGLLDGQPVAMISAVRYGQGFGFIGFYIVRPESRGQGYGLQIWNAAMARLAGRTVGLDGVVAQQDNYRKSGFVLAWNNARFEGVGGGPRPPDDAIVPLPTLPFDAVMAYDRPFFPDDRRTFLRAWIDQPGPRRSACFRTVGWPATACCARAAAASRSGRCLPTARRWRSACSSP